MVKMTLKRARELAGTVSVGNTKMPGSTYATSAKQCFVGSKLATVPGSVCDRCYALRLQKIRPHVNQAWERNWRVSYLATRYPSDPMVWVNCILYQLDWAYKKTKHPYHRWFDSGDLPHVEMLDAIVKVAEARPAFSFWLPTREAKIVDDYTGHIPDNLVIRVSSTMISDPPIKGRVHTSTVHRKVDTVYGFECGARTRGNKCGSCRACWDPTVANVSYPLH